MHIVVLAQRVWDPISVEPDPITGEIDRDRVVDVTNPADLVALEVALRLVEERGGDVAVYAVGPQSTDLTLRESLALGAHAVTRVWADWLDGAGPDGRARALAAALADAHPDLILTGNRGADQGPNAVGPMLAALLGIAQATGVDAVQVDDAVSEAIVSRRLDRGVHEELALTLPAVICVEPGIAEVRTAPFPRLLDARVADVPVFAPERPAHRGVEPRRVGFAQPRPRPHRLPTPDPEAPVEERLAFIMSRGEGKAAGRIIEGTPDELADRIVELLEADGFLP